MSAPTYRSLVMRKRLILVALALLLLCSVLLDLALGGIRDLTALLNANSPPAFEGLDEYPLVARSVVNYGMPELAGVTASTVAPAELERIVREAIRAFEPRVIPATLSVRAVEAADEGAGNVIRLEIRGEVYAEPVPEALYVKTEIDLESGQCRLRDEAGG